MIVTQDQYESAKKSRSITPIIEVLNSSTMTKVEEISGRTLSCQVSINADSDIRTTAQITIIPDSTYVFKAGSPIWLDRYIRIKIKTVTVDGIETITTQGTFAIDNVNSQYNTQSNVLTLQLVDFVGLLNGELKGQYNGFEHIIEAGTNIRTAIINTIVSAGITDYMVEECIIPTTPNQLSVDGGSTVWDLLVLLKKIYPDHYQMYFDENGQFRYEKIPTGTDEPVSANNDLLNNTIIDYSIATPYNTIRNRVEVWGKTHDVSYYSNATTSGSSYLLTIAGLSGLINHVEIGFTTDTAITNPYINLNSYGAKPLKDEYGNFAVVESGVYYVAKYQSDTDSFLFMGELTPYAVVTEDNPDSPFYINGTAGERNITLTGSDYDNIYLSSLALIRAKWELYRRCRINDTITITNVAIPWIQAYQIIEPTLINKQLGTTETNKYLIQSISTDYAVDGNQTITASRYYSYYDTE